MFLSTYYVDDCNLCGIKFKEIETVPLYLWSFLGFEKMFKKLHFFPFLSAHLGLFIEKELKNKETMKL